VEMAAETDSLRARVLGLLLAEVEQMGRPGLEIRLCLSDSSWRETMSALGCEAWNARLRSPTARRGIRGKLGMATVCHLRHGHAGVVYIRTRGRNWDEIAETVIHEAIHLARPSFSHRQVEATLHASRSRANAGISGI
jgi:hypothetical protein